MKVYCGKNRKGVWKASLDIEKLQKFQDVFESDVETIHNDKLYMIKTYHGFDYTCESIYDIIIHDYKLYHSVSAAKKSDVWKEKEKLAKVDPKNYHISPFSIATDCGGEPFVFGDAMAGDFNMSIIGIKVI